MDGLASIDAQMCNECSKVSSVICVLLFGLYVLVRKDFLPKFLFVYLLKFPFVGLYAPRATKGRSGVI